MPCSWTPRQLSRYGIVVDLNNGIRQLVMTFYERLWNVWEGTAVDAALAPDFTFRGSLGQSTTGQDGWPE